MAERLKCQFIITGDDCEFYTDDGLTLNGKVICQPCQLKYDLSRDDGPDDPAPPGELLNKKAKLTEYSFSDLEKLRGGFYQKKIDWEIILQGKRAGTPLSVMLYKGDALTEMLNVYPPFGKDHTVTFDIKETGNYHCRYYDPAKMVEIMTRSETFTCTLGCQLKLNFNLSDLNAYFAVG